MNLEPILFRRPISIINSFEMIAPFKPISRSNSVRKTSSHIGSAEAAFSEPREWRRPLRQKNRLKSFEAVGSSLVPYVRLSCS
jgi:hypothetical protein